MQIEFYATGPRYVFILLACAYKFLWFFKILLFNPSSRSLKDESLFAAYILYMYSTAMTIKECLGIKFTCFLGDMLSLFNDSLEAVF